MQNELSRLGEVFKKRREGRHLTLKEVENAISIRTSYLQAIEEGQLNKLISPIYAQGFMRKYATFLELDGEQLIKDHPLVLRFFNQQITQDQDFSLGLGSIEVRNTPGSEVKWLPNIMWVGISVLVILAGWFLARHFDFF